MSEIGHYEIWIHQHFQDAYIVASAADPGEVWTEHDRILGCYGPCHPDDLRGVTPDEARAWTLDILDTGDICRWLEEDADVFYRQRIGEE